MRLPTCLLRSRALAGLTHAQRQARGLSAAARMPRRARVFQQPQTSLPQLPHSAFFSSDSHDDFAPKRKEVDGTDEAVQMIQEHVDANPVMLYMKGSPAMPMCGFSAKVVQALQAEGADFASVNVLDYPSVREGVKKFSEWPTIPQLYVNGEFIGGCDIVLAMQEKGELADLFKEGVAKEE